MLWDVGLRVREQKVQCHHVGDAPSAPSTSPQCRGLGVANCQQKGGADQEEQEKMTAESLRPT